VADKDTDEVEATLVIDAATQQAIANQGLKGAPAKDTLQAQLVVIGSGPGGYTAAFRAADLAL
jgi:dihydrolipoamide dehydrogenase